MLPASAQLSWKRHVTPAPGPFQRHSWSLFVLENVLTIRFYLRGKKPKNEHHHKKQNAKKPNTTYSHSWRMEKASQRGKEHTKQELKVRKTTESKYLFQLSTGTVIV